MQETSVQSLGWEDPLEEDMATNSRVLAWKMPWTEEMGSRDLRSHAGYVPWDLRDLVSD